MKNRAAIICISLLLLATLESHFVLFWVRGLQELSLGVKPLEGAFVEALGLGSGLGGDRCGGLYTGIYEVTAGARGYISKNLAGIAVEEGK